MAPAAIDPSRPAGGLARSTPAVHGGILPVSLRSHLAVWPKRGARLCWPSHLACVRALLGDAAHLPHGDATDLEVPHLESRDRLLRELDDQPPVAGLRV